MEHYKRHVFIWKILRGLIAPWLKLKFAYTFDPVDVEGPCIILPNHNTDWDPLLISISMPFHMYFVASEHIFRWGLLTRLIRWAIDPISRLKASTAADTALTAIRRMRKGASVCLFPEGNRSWDGVTQDIFPATGKLVRASGATLITYRIEGGYFTCPRWAGNRLRRGRMQGHTVGIYPPEQLKKMSPEQINDIIRRDLHEDAYARQLDERIPFRGRALAESLEHILCVCPVCGGISTMHSSGDLLTCSACGLQVRYNEYGLLEGDAPFDTIRDWDQWQSGQLKALATEAGEKPIFSDDDVQLLEVLSGHVGKPIASGRITLYRDRLECPGMVFPLPELKDLALHGPRNLDINAFGRHFELKSRRVLCTRKYLTACSALLADPV